ncbi:hypothetical protein Tcan_01215, partial [Toxocara canis]
TTRAKRQSCGGGCGSSSSQQGYMGYPSMQYQSPQYQPTYRSSAQYSYVQPTSYLNPTGQPYQYPSPSYQYASSGQYQAPQQYQPVQYQPTAQYQ